MVAALVAVHLSAFYGILHLYPEWRMIWFAPVIIVEGVLFGVITDALVGPLKSVSRART
jgi:hypothetical protein